MCHFFRDMMKCIRILVVLISLMTVKNVIEASEEAVKKITSGFLKMLDECKHELNLPEHILADFYHYWKEDFELLNRDTGCAIICMSKKLNLLDREGKIHHGNAQEFAMRHGADGSVASKLIDILHECEKESVTNTDDCMRALDVAKCFRTGIHKLNWAPKMDVIVTELLTEI